MPHPIKKSNTFKGVSYVLLFICFIGIFSLVMVNRSATIKITTLENKYNEKVSQMDAESITRNEEIENVKKGFDAERDRMKKEYRMSRIYKEQKVNSFDAQTMWYNVKDVCEHLRDLRICGNLSFGTLLGAMREHAVIEHDHDADIMCHLEDMDTVRRLLHPRLSKLGFYVLREIHVENRDDASDGTNESLFSYVRPDNHYTDVYFKLWSNDMSWIPWEMYGKIQGYLPFPVAPELYLETIYDEWRVKDKGLGHKSKPSEIDFVRGTRQPYVGTPYFKKYNNTVIIGDPKLVNTNVRHELSVLPKKNYARLQYQKVYSDLSDIDVRVKMMDITNTVSLGKWSERKTNGQWVNFNPDLGNLDTCGRTYDDHRIRLSIGERGSIFYCLVNKEREKMFLGLGLQGDVLRIVGIKTTEKECPGRLVWTILPPLNVIYLTDKNVFEYVQSCGAECILNLSENKFYLRVSEWACILLPEISLNRIINCWSSF